MVYLFCVPRPAGSGARPWRVLCDVGACVGRWASATANWRATEIFGRAPCRWRVRGLAGLARHATGLLGRARCAAAGSRPRPPSRVGFGTAGRAPGRLKRWLPPDSSANAPPTSETLLHSPQLARRPTQSRGAVFVQTRTHFEARSDVSECGRCIFPLRRRPFRAFFSLAFLGTVQRAAPCNRSLLGSSLTSFRGSPAARIVSYRAVRR